MIQKGFNINLHSKLHPVFWNTVAISDNNGELVLNTLPVLCLVHMLVISFNPHKNH